MQLTDAYNEARDNVKYLNSMEPVFEPLYGINPEAMMAGLKPLMQNVLTLRKIARYYGTPQRLGLLLSKVSNQLIKASKEYILAPGAHASSSSSSSSSSVGDAIMFHLPSVGGVN